jgi:glutamine synthetase type III
MVYKGTPERKVLSALTESALNIQKLIDNLDNVLSIVQGLKDDVEKSASEAAKFVPLFNEIRAQVDRAEQYVADEHWPYPKYAELLFGA